MLERLPRRVREHRVIVPGACGGEPVLAKQLAQGWGEHDVPDRLQCLRRDVLPVVIKLITDPNFELTTSVIAGLPAQRQEVSVLQLSVTARGAHLCPSGRDAIMENRRLRSSLVVSLRSMRAYEA